DILSRGLLHKGVFYQSPLYPYILALVYKIGGHSLRLISWLQVIVGSAACALIALTAHRHFGAVAGWVAGLLAAADRVLIVYSAPTLKETLIVFTLAAAVYFSLAMADEGRKRDGLWAGLGFGFTALMRSNVVAIFVVVAMAAVWRLRRQALLPLTICFLAI